MCGGKREGKMAQFVHEVSERPVQAAVPRIPWLLRGETHLRGGIYDALDSFQMDTRRLTFPQCHVKLSRTPSWNRTLSIDRGISF